MQEAHLSPQGEADLPRTDYAARTSETVTLTPLLFPTIPRDRLVVVGIFENKPGFILQTYLYHLLGIPCHLGSHILLSDGSPRLP